jgi:integrase
MSAEGEHARRTHRTRAIGKLTTIHVQRAKRRGLYGDGGGLFLQVAKGGSKSWIFRFKEAGRLRVMGLGPLHTVSLAEAREKALACRKLRLDDIDPIAARREKRIAAKVEAAKAITFRDAAEKFIDAHKAGWRNPRHALQWPATLEAYVYPVFGSLPVSAIDTALVMKALEPVWKTRPETASRVRGRIESVLDWASAREYRRGDNPARWRGHLENLLPKRSKVRRVEHLAALPYQQMAAFMAALRQEGGIDARALEFAILTAARTGDVIGARWDEFDLDERLWIIPGERMKAGKEHRVPLSDAAMSILEGMQAIRSGDYVFPGARRKGPLIEKAMLLVLRRMGHADLTVHGFRSSFRDWAAERTAFPAEVAEMALAHTVANRVEAAYRRGDMFQKRRQLADAWAAFCGSPVVGGDVVPLRGKRSNRETLVAVDRVCSPTSPAPHRASPRHEGSEESARGRLNAHLD